MTKTPQPSSSELLKHFQYEVDMLEWTFAQVPLFPMEEQTRIRNALIESFCVHARSLIEFFSKCRDRSAWDLSDHKYKPFDPKKDLGDDLVKKLNNQISHLMDGRTNDITKKIGPHQQTLLMKVLTEEIKRFDEAMGHCMRVPNPKLDGERTNAATNSIFMTCSVGNITSTGPLFTYKASID